MLEAVGAGVALGAGAGGVVGGAIVGFCFGAADAGAAAGRELWLAAGAPPWGWLAVLELADCLDERLDADADGDAEGLVPLADGDGADVPVDGCVAAPLVVATLCAVLAKSEAIPNAVTTLSKVARQVSRDRRRIPESRPARRLRCLMEVAQQDRG